MKRIVTPGVVFWFTLLILIGTSVKATWADGSEYKNYVKAGLGLHRFTGGLDDADYDAGIAFNATYGRYLGKNFAVEGTIGFFGTEQDFSGSTGVAGAYTREDKILVSSVLGTLKGELPLGPVTIYAGAGVGVYYAALDSEIETTSLGSFDVDEGDAVFGVHLVVGGSYDITPRVFVGAQGMYRWTGDLDIDKTTGTVPVRVDGDLDGFAVTLSAGFRF